jgi:hypothetical protein
MRILLILIIIIAAFVVIQAHRHHCKYDSTLISCVLGKSGAPAGGETSQPAPAPETPAPATPPAEPAPATPPAQQ